MKARDVERFWSKVSPEPNTGCWLWLGTFDRDGYGFFKCERKMLRPHRIMAGLLPGNALQACHRCDNRACVNPDHIFLGTNRDNHLDKIHKGRQARGPQRNPSGKVGSRHHRSKLTERDVAQILVSKEPGVVLAARYGVTPTTVCLIRARRIWRHVCA